MPQQTSMTLYRDVVLECQHCYMICRYSEAAVRCSCPSCGRTIANWTAIVKAVRNAALKSSQQTALAVSPIIPPCPKSDTQERD